MRAASEVMGEYRPSIPLSHAMLCVDPECELVFEAGEPCCPSCTGRGAIPLSRVLNPPVEDDGLDWHEVLGEMHVKEKFGHERPQPRLVVDNSD